MYAAALRSALTEAGLANDILVPRPGVPLERQHPALGSAPWVILHYVGYGYQQRGCPSWLPRLLNNWRGGSPERRLATVFHEVAAGGPPWRSSFWTRPLQLRIARRIAALSDLVTTSTEAYRRLLRRSDTMLLPVFSTIGEPTAVAGTEQRAASLVVFGGAGTRGRVWARPERVRRVCTVFEIDEIWDIGPPLAGVPGSLGRCRVAQLGTLTSSEVADHLTRARVGLLDYPPALLGKSTVYAAYAAHGVAPVCLVSSSKTAADAPHLTADAASRESGAATAHRAVEWYREHSLERHAALYAETFGA